MSATEDPRTHFLRTVDTRITQDPTKTTILTPPLVEPTTDDNGVGEEEHVDDELQPYERLRLSVEYTSKYKKVLRQIRRANNDLSLVLASESGKLICFGDIGGKAPEEVLLSLSNLSFDVMLAPHHGTHALPDNVPSVRWCISQGGKRHLKPRLDMHLRQQHETEKECWNTSKHGEFKPSKPQQ